MLNPEIITTTFFNYFMQLLIYSGIALVTCFFPLAGILADIKFGRCKTIITSIYLVLLSLLLLILSSIFGGCYWSLTIIISYFVAILCLFLVCGGISLIILYTGTANVVQFGMDQLHDSPGENRTLFIHWYVWTYYGSKLAPNLLTNTRLQCVAVPSLTVRMRCPWDWTSARRSTGDPSPQNRWRMSKHSMEYSKCCSALEPLGFAADSSLQYFECVSTPCIANSRLQWSAFSTAYINLHPSLPPLHFPLCPRNAEENGTRHDFSSALVTCNAIHGHSGRFGI